MKLFVKGPTVFPVLYALVVGGAIRSLAMWRLQTGERIYLLDLLLGSTTFGSTVATQLERQITQVDIVSLLLLVLWSLSPLGGQASLRVASYQDFPIIETLKLNYLDFSNASFPYGMCTGDTGPQLDIINSAFMASLASSLSVKESPLDPWGNIKIPVIESLPGYHSENEEEWVVFPGYSEATPYSSLIGIPVANISRTGITEFSLETAYWNLQCPEYGYSNLSTADSWLEEVKAAVEGCSDSCPVYNEVISDGSLVDGVIMRWGAILSKTREGDVVRRCQEEATEDTPTRQIFLESWNDRGTNRAKIRATCNLATTYVEVTVKCQGWDCEVSRIRKSQNHRRHKSPSYTVLDACSSDSWEGSAAAFLVNFVDATDHYLKSSSAMGVLQGYIFSPDRPFSELVSPNSYLDLSVIGNKSFAMRFSQLLNSYFSAYYNYNLTFERHPQGLAYDGSYYFSKDPTTEAIGTNTRLETRFVFSRGWMVVLVLATSVMLTSGVIKFVFDLKIWIPDLLMNVSTLLRGSMPHCPNLPFGGTTLDDSDRSRLLKDRMVRFGNIRAEDGSAGELWIGELAEDEGHVTEVARDKTYW